MSPPTFDVPDERTWVYVDQQGFPAGDTKQPIYKAHIPIGEVAKIFAIVAYVNRQLDGCNAIGK